MMELKAQQVQMVRKAMLEQQDLRVIQVHKEPQDLKAQQDHREEQVQEVHKEIQVHKEI